jgi:hypothetical protein
MSDRLFVVVTTVQQPTTALAQLANTLRALNVPLVVVGDRKGPEQFALPGAELLTLAMQESGPFRLGRNAPTGHYARKNLGYLAALARGATSIYETDDDNAPMNNWAPRQKQVQAISLSEGRWANVYAHFTDDLIWPRGYPLECVRYSACKKNAHAATVTSSIQQGLANGSPDVDAIWRLILDRPFEFRGGPSVALAAGSFCPFNSQSTWWWTPAFPLLYLPSHCSFRMTDIWRGFIAQRCLWEVGESLVFHGAEVAQDRNQHKLLDDFRDEIPGYLANGEICEVLASTRLASGPEMVGPNLLRCYEALSASGYTGREEIALVQFWLDDLAVATSLSRSL